MDKIRVLVADDQTLFREGLRIIFEFEPDIELVGEAEDGIHALELAERLQPDVLLLDIRMKNMDGLKTAHKMREICPKCKVIMLTGFDDRDYILESLKAGAKGFLMKDLTSDEVTRAIRKVHGGGTILPPDIATTVVEELSRLARLSKSRQGDFASRHGLTPRELEILDLLARGMTNKEISQRLFLSEGTVKNHVSSIYDKLGIYQRTQVMLHAREHGLGKGNDTTAT